MKFRVKLLVMIVVIVLVSLSLFNVTTSPVQSSTTTYNAVKHYEFQGAMPIGNISLSNIGQNVTYFIIVNMLRTNWTANQPFELQLYAIKTAQDISFPFTSATIQLSKMTLSVDGVTIPVKYEGITKSFNESILQFSYQVTPLNSFAGKVKLSMEVTAGMEVFSSIYHFLIWQENFNFIQSVKLG